MTSPRVRRRRSQNHTTVSKVVLIIWKGTGLLLLTGACFAGLMMHFHHHPPHSHHRSSSLLTSNNNSEEVGNPNYVASDLIRSRTRSIEQQVVVDGKSGDHDDEEEYYPRTFIDLWPDDRNTEDYRNYLLNCMPGYKYQESQQRDCRVRLKEDTNVESIQQQQQQSSSSSAAAATTPMIKRVALVRPPGRFGDIFVQYVQQVVDLALQQQQQQQSEPESEQQLLLQQQPKIQLVPTLDVIDSNHEYSMILRLATLPVLLEVADVALSLNEEETTTDESSVKMNSVMKPPTDDDLLDLLRYTIRWHCSINQRTHDTALLTITLDRIIGFPSSTGKKIQQFLGIYDTNASPPPTASAADHHNHKKKKQLIVNLKKLPLMVIDRINSASSLVSNSIHNKETASALLQLVERVIKEELDASSSSSSCRSINTLLDNSSIARRLQKDHRIPY